MSVLPASNVGVLGIGVYLPTEVRTNDYWPTEVAQRWLAERRAMRAVPSPPAPTTGGMARVMSALSEQQDDPFQGAIERRVMADSMTAYDMEEAAARDAIERARIGLVDINAVLTHTPVPEYLLANSACVLHHRLGLARECLSLQTEAAAYSFLAQLEMARALIATGSARHVLLVQSSAVSRLLDYDDYDSPVFGDGATAVVVGRVGASRGVLAASHRTDGQSPRTLVATVRAGRWYDGGRIVLHLPDAAAMRAVAVQTADLCKEAVDAALGEAGLRPADVGFFSIHQGTAWLRRVAQDHTGLTSARSIDTFPSTGYLFAANIPIGLRMAEDAGQLGEDDVVAMFGGGTGMTYGATVMRWGAR